MELPVTESDAATAHPANEAPYPKAMTAWYATLVLAVIYWLSVLDRFIISLMVGPIKRDMGISDVQFGLLQGFAFSLTFCIFGLGAGALADRFSRRWIIFAGVSIWSAATSACGLALHFWQLLLARVGVGVGEAALTPSATSMLTDLFPKQRLTMAMAIFAMGATFGSGCAYLFGGLIIDLVSKHLTIVLPLVGEVRSWQAVFFIVGIPGTVLSLSIFTVPEPARRGLRSVHRGWMFWQKAYRDFLRFFMSRPRFFLCHYAGFGLASAVLTGTGAWYPALMGRKYGWSPSQIGLGLGVTIAASGLLCQLICGRVVEAMYRRGYRDAPIRWYAGCLLAATPFGVIATTSASPWVFLGTIAVFLVLISSLTACCASSLNMVTPNELRGTGYAFFAATGGLIGSASGAVLIAAVSEHVYGGESSIGLGIATVMAVFCPLGALCLALGFRAMREGAIEAEGWAGR